MPRTIAFFLIPLLSGAAMAQNAAVIKYGGTNMGSVRGMVVTVSPDGSLLSVPNAKLQLAGAASFVTEADAAGKYAFGAVPAGEYQLEATAPGLAGSEHIEVVAEADLDMTIAVALERAKASVSVTAGAPAEQPIDEVPAVTETILRELPNKNDRLDTALPLIPGVVRGPDGLISMKGARASQGGSLLNGANVTDPVTGTPAIRLPIDVVSSVRVLSNPYDPEYGKLTGAVSTVETRTGNFEKLHFSLQNVMPRTRKRDGHFVGIESATPRATLTGPIYKDRIALTQSLEYRFVRTPVNSLPALERDMKLESFDLYNQTDYNISERQTATVTFALYPQKADFLGLNTFTPQPATSNLHERAEMVSAQHRFITGAENYLVSQLSYRKNDSDVTGHSNDQYRMYLDTTEGGYYNRQHRDTDRVEWQETYHFAHFEALGSHQLKAGVNYVHNSYDGRFTFRPVELYGADDRLVQTMQFGPESQFGIGQHEAAWFVTDRWNPIQRVTLDYGLRLDYDSVTEKTNAAPRAGLAIALTNDNRTLLKAGGGLFYDRVPLNIPAFPKLPGRTVTRFDAAGNPQIPVAYLNALSSDLQNPRGVAWNIELDREVIEHLQVRVEYQQRNSSRDFIISPDQNTLLVSNSGLSTYRELQFTGRYRIRRQVLNASYVHSRAYGDLNDYGQFFGNTPQAVIQPNQRGRLPWDAPNRFLFWGEFAAPGEWMIAPLFEYRTGFPYSVQNEMREYLGERSSQRYRQFVSLDAQVTRTIRMPIIGRAKVGFAVFNVMNHYNPREVQNNLDSERFGQSFNSVGRTFRGKFVVEF